MEFSFGQMLALLGAVLAAVLAGIGSAKSVGMAGEASAGLVSENPDLAGKCLVLQVLPGTQGIYGFLVAVLLVIKVNLLGGSGMAPLTVDQGLQLFLGCLPIALGGLASAIYQGRVACSGINMLATQPESSGRAILMTVMVETYAVFALLVSVLLVWFTVV